MGFLLRLLSCSAMLEFDQHSWSPITGSSQPPYSQWMFVCVSLIDVRLNLRHSSQNFLEWGHSIQLWERLHSSTCSVLILIRRRVDVVASFLKLALPFGFFFKEYKAIWDNRLCLVGSYFCILRCDNIRNKHRLGLLVENLPLFWIDPFLFLWSCLNFALLKII